MVTGVLRGITSRGGHQGWRMRTRSVPGRSRDTPGVVPETPLPCPHTAYVRRGEGVGDLESRKAHQ
jgi:hypothetical protein